jgi:hypothetical protein
MNIALFANPGSFEPIQGLLRWWTSTRSTVRHPAARPVQAEHYSDPKFIATCATVAKASGQKIPLLKPLRVVRVVESGQARSCVGRMVISGRMADVCAELDRLAACESALN